MKLGNLDKYFALIAEVLRSLSRFILGIAIARFLGPESYGVFVVMLTVEIILHTLANALWAAPMASLAPGLEEPARSQMIRSASFRHWRGSLISGVGTLALAPWLMGEGVSALEMLFFSLSIATCGGLNLERARVASSFRSRAGLTADLWSTALPVAAVAAAYAAGGSIALAYWASRAFGAAASCWAIRRAVPLRGASVTVDLARFNEMGRHMAIGSVANSACSRAQPFVLASFATAVELGLFGAALALTGPMRMATAALSGVLRPRLALHFGGGDNSRAWRTAYLALAGVYALGVAALALTWLIGAQVCAIAFGPEFPKLESLLLLAVVYAVFASGNALLVVVIQVAVNAAVAAKMRIAVGAVSLAAVGPCVLHAGAAGAFGSLIAAECFYALIGAAVLVHARKRPLDPFERDAEGPQQARETGAPADRSAA